MKKIYVLDTTLRDGEQSPGVSLTLQEKLEIAVQLEKLGIDRIEAGFPATSPGEVVSVREIARTVKNSSIVALSRARVQDIEAAREALQYAQDPCLHIFLATSPIHRQFKLRMTREQVLASAEEAIRYGKRHFSKIQFSAEDASRTELDFLCDVVTMAIRAGAVVINLPDTVGYATPEQYAHMFTTVRQTVPGIERVQLSAHCHNDLGMATANTLAAIAAGVDQIEGTMNGIGERAGNTAIEEVAMSLEVRADVYAAKTSLVLAEMYRTSRLVSHLTGMVVPGNKAIVGHNAFAHESGIHQDGMLKDRSTYEIMLPETIGLKASKLVLGKHSGRHAFKEKLVDMGYALNETQLNEAFVKFKSLVDKKKNVVDDDIRALIEEKLGAGNTAFTLDHMHVSYDNQSSPIASVRVSRPDGSAIEEVSLGNGSVDALYNAIDKATGEDVELTDYAIHSVTNGKDALGEVHLVLKQAHQSAQGRGVSTDILEASGKAYIDAINRLINTRFIQPDTNRDHISIS